VQAQIIEITQPIKVQPRNKFNIKMARLFLWRRMTATTHGRKYKDKSNDKPNKDATTDSPDVSPDSIGVSPIRFVEEV